VHRRHQRRECRGGPAEERNEGPHKPSTHPAHIATNVHPETQCREGEHAKGSREEDGEEKQGNARDFAFE
jgi:hypothetical protein